MANNSFPQALVESIINNQLSKFNLLAKDNKEEDDYATFFLQLYNLSQYESSRKQVNAIVGNHVTNSSTEKAKWWSSSNLIRLHRSFLLAVVLVMWIDVVWCTSSSVKNLDVVQVILVTPCKPYRTASNSTEEWTAVSLNILKLIIKN